MRLPWKPSSWRKARVLSHWGGGHSMVAYRHMCTALSRTWWGSLANHTSAISACASVSAAFFFSRTAVAPK